MKASLIFVLAMLLAASTAPATTRQQDVRTRGMHVMPFSMNDTMHMFHPSANGGTMEVVVRDDNAHQIALVRQHLNREAAAFARGNYSDPADIHGRTMPGLRELSSGASRIRVQYAQTNSGARISFTTSDPALVSALHRWFRAQVSDHGRDAMMM